MTTTAASFNADNAAMALQKEFAELTSTISKLSQTRKQLMAQLNENEGVKIELNCLTPENELYRTLGPSLLRTELVEAKSLVDGRIDRIKKDLKRVEEQVEQAGKRRLAIRQEQEELAKKSQSNAS